MIGQACNVGLYKPVNNVFGFNANDGDYAVTGRLTWLPIYEDEGRQLMHLGVSGRQATTYDDRIRFRTRDAIRGGRFGAVASAGRHHRFWRHDAVDQRRVCRGARAVDDAGRVADELHQRRPAARRAARRLAPNVDSLFYQGGYVQLLYFLTGESDNYSLEKMAFDRVKPFENFFWVRGADCCNYCSRGAWQVGARYNYLDLNDQGINGGQLHNGTLGLNWFWNPNTKVQFNYIATYRDVSETADFPDGSGWINGWGIRFAQDF